MRYFVIVAVATLSLLVLAAGCEELAGTSEGKSWTISTQQGQDGPLLTLNMRSTVEDEATGKTTPLEIQISGEGGSEWGAGIARQGVAIKLVSVGGPSFTDDPLMFVPNGTDRNVFGGGEPASEVRQVNGQSVNCPIYVAHGSASAIRVMVGSRFVSASVGPVKFRLDDEQVRAMAELMRRLDGTVPK
jgi:hypothetical protein